MEGDITRGDCPAVDSKLPCPVYVAHDLSGFLLSNVSAVYRNFVAQGWPTINDHSHVRSWDRAAAWWTRSAGHRRDSGLRTEAHGTRPGFPRVFVHPHRDLHIMEPVRVLPDLQRRTLIPHRMVVGHDPLFLDTEDIGEAGPNPGDEGGVCLLGGHLKLPGEGRQELIPQKPIRCCHVRDARQGPFVRQPILKCPEHALGPAPCFGRISRNAGDS